MIHRIDILGVGFGPSNLALAIAIEEMGGEHVLSKTLFLEAKSSFTWHPGMMLDNSRVQVSFLKDLATLRNPQSYYTFLNYLHANNRLTHFINLQTFSPTRYELNDYFSWAAHQFSSHVRYGHRLVEVRPIIIDDVVEELEVVAIRNSDNQLQTFLTQTLVVATGGVPRVPEFVKLLPNGRTFHTSTFKHNIKSSFPDPDANYSFVVVGGGQSSAEVFLYLSQNYPIARVKWKIRDFALRPMDDSCFVNEIFFPESVDLFFNLNAAQKELFFNEYLHANYSAVDSTLIVEIYHLLYGERLRKSDRLTITRFQQMESLVEESTSVQITCRHIHSNEVTIDKADAVILATGYRDNIYEKYLKPLATFFVLDSAKKVSISRDYQIQTSSSFKPRIFLQGHSESTHGISDTLLSILSVRAGCIVHRILNNASKQRS